MPSDAVVTEDLTKVYGKLTAVDHVNVKVASGTGFGLLGPNGAGKTTMIKLLTGLTDMTEGEAWVAGFDVRRDPMHVKQRIGWVASEVILDDDFTAWENLWLQAKLQSLPEWKERAADLLTYFGLNDRRKDRVKTFSTGMRKNVELETGEAVDEAKLRAIPGVTAVRSQGKTWILQVSAAEEVLPHIFSTLKTDEIRRINVEKPSLETVFLDITGKRIDQAGADVP